jgi:hypothetical protein
MEEQMEHILGGARGRTVTGDREEIDAKEDFRGNLLKAIDASSCSLSGATTELPMGQLYATVYRRETGYWLTIWRNNQIIFDKTNLRIDQIRTAMAPFEFPAYLHWKPS